MTGFGYYRIKTVRSALRICGWLAHNWATGMALAALGLILLVSLHVLNFENPPIVFHNLPFPTNQAQYKAGDMLIVNAEFTRYTDAPFTLLGEFRDGIVVMTVPQLRAGNEVGYNKIMASVVVIPATLPPGVWTYCAKAEYRVGPFGLLRHESWCTQRFRVVQEDNGV